MEIGDPWWDTKQLLVQLKDAIDTFELKHPGCVGVFVFDQSSAHNSHGEGALDAFGMNLGPGGAVEPQNDTYYPPEAATKVGEPQCLWTEELVEVVINDGKVEVVKAKTVDKGKKAPKAKGKRGKGKKAVNAKPVVKTEPVIKNEPVIKEGGVRMELRRVPKGIRAILEERGCYPPTKANGNPACKAKCSKPKCLDPAKYPPPPGPPCCMARILQNHKDFREQQSIIAQLIEDRGHKCVFLPKFHCELNPIEMYWGYAKARFRQVVKKTTKDGKREVPLALDACTTDILRRFCNRSFRFMDAYRKGLTITQAAWCVKKQKGHRAISKQIMDSMDENM